ncbi:unnamed protein product [Adineta ricciae]|uniref:Transmembrane protein n=1 Tax=Adineta ricciae TaxID=249248 RepID=A0A813TAQ9_ADIRI|nr:unnamed protein product [Adineta ricciae]CAF1444329.1 unnamed protein product [Adineta ricciae]
MSIYVFFLFLIYCSVSWCQYDLADVTRDTRMSVNDDMFVTASNAFINFAVLLYPFRNATAGEPISCNIIYSTSDFFVRSIAVVGVTKNSTNSEQFMYVFTAEKMSTITPYVCTVTVTKSTCAASYSCTVLGRNGYHPEYFLVGVDTNSTHAYGFTSEFVFKLDIYANEIVLNLTTDDVWPSQSFIPHALDVADTWAVVAGYGYEYLLVQGENRCVVLHVIFIYFRTGTYRALYQTVGCLIDLSQLINASCVPITSETSYLIPSNVISYNELYELSVAIRGQKVLIGIPRLSSVVILCHFGSSLNVTRTHLLSFMSSPSIGRVVDWSDDTTIAILIDDAYETDWSTTQIFFYDEDLVTITSPFFTFPNNQQIMGTRLLRPKIARFMITTGGNMGMITSNDDMLIIPLASTGYVSTWNETTKRTFSFYYIPTICIGGTYKNRSSLGPCSICPPGTRNPSLSSTGISQCMSCSSNASCPLASLSEINFTTAASYSQAVPYPETTDATDIEDFLIENVFQINSKPHCVLISPLFWALVVGGLCLLYLTFILLTHLFNCTSCMRCHGRAKIVFKHTDIINEGEMWLGGLATFAIVVLAAFTYWFSVSFIRRYPIENIFQPATFACDESLINAQFSTGLELLTIPKSNEAQPIFNLLDKQTFNLTVELINTGFACSSITVQENLLTSKYVVLPSDCHRSIEIAITSVTITLPKHLTTIQVNMTGPYSIGGIRLCVRGQGETNGAYTLRELDFCQFYMTANQVIGRYTYVPIVFVKNINVTQALDTKDPTVYSGIWMPTFSEVSLSDEDYYTEYGNYLRYTSSLTVLQVMFDEHPFYMKNIQQPIVRAPELIFHNLLFTSLCIELFAFAFLFLKLLVIPICRPIVHRCNKTINRNGEHYNEDVSKSTDE